MCDHWHRSSPYDQRPIAAAAARLLLLVAMNTPIPGKARTLEPGYTYIIDDDDSVRVALERLLIARGLHVRAFPSAQAFISSGASADGACVIVDVMMHGMSGLELCRKLQSDGARAGFIMVTAHDTPEARQQAHEVGAMAYFRKPVDAQALVDAIEWTRSRIGAPARTG